MLLSLRNPIVPGSIAVPLQALLWPPVPSPGTGQGIPRLRLALVHLCVSHSSRITRQDKYSSSHGVWGTALTPLPCTPARESRDNRDHEAGDEHGQIRLQAARGREIGREQQCSKKGF